MSFKSYRYLSGYYNIEVNSRFIECKSYCIIYVRIPNTTAVVHAETDSNGYSERRQTKKKEEKTFSIVVMLSMVMVGICEKVYQK